MNEYDRNIVSLLSKLFKRYVRRVKKHFKKKLQRRRDNELDIDASIFFSSFQSSFHTPAESTDLRVLLFIQEMCAKKCVSRAFGATKAGA